MQLSSQRDYHNHYYYYFIAVVVLPWLLAAAEAAENELNQSDGFSGHELFVDISGASEKEENVSKRSTLFVLHKRESESVQANDY